MNIEQAVLENLKQLPLKQQEEVLNFSEFLKQKSLLSLPEKQLTAEEKSANWRLWVQSHTSNNPPLPEEALHRDMMYEDEY
jgi:hypothetical protein